jgi:hypothetical protein
MDGMDNGSYWKEYEKVTGEKRPPWIDGVGNVNYSFGKKAIPKQQITAREVASQLPQIQPQQFNPNLMPAPVNPWRIGLRGWQPGW